MERSPEWLAKADLKIHQHRRRDIAREIAQAKREQETGEFGDRSEHIALLEARHAAICADEEACLAKARGDKPAPASLPKPPTKKKAQK